jgi:hypothetical protein
MSFLSPNLDDRSFADLVEEARLRILQTCPEWNDLSPGDPGIVLLELFAYLTETMIYRLNRLPEKAYIEFLRLMGVRLQPPAAAATHLVFRRATAGQGAIELPAGTRVAAARSSPSGEAPVFTTAAACIIPPDSSEGAVLAYHCDVVRAELLGTGTGLPGLSVMVHHPPIIAPTGDRLDLVVGIEAGPDELEDRAPAIEAEGKIFRIWQEVLSFAQVEADSYAYLVDRPTGAIIFAPAVRRTATSGGAGQIEDRAAALAAVPPAGREIRAWYRTGGGTAGNVAAGVLTVLKDPQSGVSVNNPEPATGGRDAETLENALLRGPHEIHSLERAVTARDFELLALRSSGAVVRARALTRAALWAHAMPGTVEVLLVPYVAEDDRSAAGAVTPATLAQLQTEEARSQVQNALDERRPLGVTCLASWARYKSVTVRARAVVRREEDLPAVQARVERRLYQTINPLPVGPGRPGWSFGQALRASHIYDIILGEPGVLYVDSVRLAVDEVPSQAVGSIAADRHQARTWYAGSGPILFRSLNDGDGWEPAGRFDDQQIAVVRIHPQRPGLVAVATHTTSRESVLHLSYDCGESWEPAAQLAFAVTDAAWMDRGDRPVLLLATGVGLYELELREGATPVQIVVDPSDRDRGLYAVVVATEVRGQVSVAVAAQQAGGVFLSSEGGVSETFRSIGREGDDVRLLAVQYDGPRSFLWAGITAAAPDDDGDGCLRRELLGSEEPPGGWRAYASGWTGGSCRALAFQGLRTYAATHHRGVMRLDLSQNDPAWEPPDIRCGLPLRDAGRLLFRPVDTVAVDPAERVLLAGGEGGVLRSLDGGLTYQSSSESDFRERVTLPDTWLFCSGSHDVAVVGEDETERD